MSGREDDHDPCRKTNENNIESQQLYISNNESKTIAMDINGTNKGQEEPAANGNPHYEPKDQVTVVETQFSEMNWSNRNLKRLEESKGIRKGSTKTKVQKTRVEQSMTSSTYKRNLRKVNSTMRAMLR